MRFACIVIVVRLALIIQPVPLLRRMWNLAEASSQCCLSSLSLTPLPSEGLSGLVV